MFVYMAQPATWPVQRFRATLEHILDKTGLSQAGLAALVPMDQSQLSRWKSGVSRPKFESLTALGEALRARYPSLDVGPNELLESAGYAPPEPVVHVSQVALRVPGPASSGVRIERRNGSHVTYEVTIESGLTMEQAIRSLGELATHERALVRDLQLLEFGPDEVQGAVLFVRSQPARHPGTDAEGLRRDA